MRDISLKHQRPHLHFQQVYQSHRWEIELKLERGDIPLSSKSSSQNLGDILSRYQTDVTSKKRGAEPESFRIGKILRHPICSINLSKLTSKDMAEYRDGRLEEVCPASVVMALMLVSHAIDIARKSGVSASLRML